MRGFPKMLSSKEDYYNIKKLFPNQWREHWQALLDTMMGWYPVKELKSPEDAIQDAHHKVLEMDDYTVPVADGEEPAKKYVLYEERENPECKLYRLGFTVEEVEKALAA